MEGLKKSLVGCVLVGEFGEFLVRVSLCLRRLLSGYSSPKLVKVDNPSEEINTEWLDRGGDGLKEVEGRCTLMVKIGTQLAH
jgi:hypothetical protein